MNFHLFLDSTNQFSFDEPTTLVVGICSTQTTRKALAAADSLLLVSNVTGWVDISSPHLVDLLDDLTTGPGGSKLTDLRVRLTSQDVQNMPVQRGLAIIAEADLGIRFETKYADANATRYLSSVGALPFPGFSRP